MVALMLVALMSMGQNSHHKMISNIILKIRTKFWLYWLSKFDIWSSYHLTLGQAIFDKNKQMTSLKKAYVWMADH